MIRGRKEALKAHMGEGEAPVVRLPEGEEMVELTIDGVPVSVPKGTTVLAAALSRGLRIPYFCYHPGLSPEGNCRMCLVQLEGRPNLEPSCVLPVAPGMAVKTETPAVEEARRGVMEFLLLNHPLDCPWCDKAGECMLQDNSFDYGPGEPRHDLAKRTYPVKDFSERYAALSTNLSGLLEEIGFGAQVTDDELSRTWTERNDAQNYAVVGDPGVRLRVEDME